MYTVIFLGTSDFAVPSLQKLAKSEDFKISLVITQPDAPQGRKKILTPTPVRIAAQKLNFGVLTPQKIKEPGAIKKIAELKPDFLILAAYGQILPKELLACAKYGAINIHPSLLPKYRGPSPVQFAILNGENETGISIILMDEELDHGPILAQQKTEILPSETMLELKIRLALEAADLLLGVLPDFARGKIKAEPQNHAKATFTKILKRADGHIDWKKSAKEIYDQWRAFEPWPGIFSELRIKNEELRRIILTKIRPVHMSVEEIKKIRISKIFIRGKNLFVRCGQGIIQIERLQIEGGKVLSAQHFLNGHQEIVSSLLS